LATKQSSAEKRHRQSEERRIRNKSTKSAIKTSVKKFTTSIQDKDAGVAEANLKDIIKKLDTAAGKGILHKNTVARKKSRMQKLFNTLKTAQ
jgi:small subunit ribosomal protein S20